MIELPEILFLVICPVLIAIGYIASYLYHKPSERGVWLTEKYIIDKMDHLQSLLSDKDFVEEVGVQIEYWKGKHSAYGEILEFIIKNNKPILSKKDAKEVCDHIDYVIRELQQKIG